MMPISFFNSLVGISTSILFGLYLSYGEVAAVAFRSVSVPSSLPIAITGQESPRRTVIAGGTIIDGTGHDPVQDGVVIIEGNNIVAIGKEDEIERAEEDLLIDATGKYIIPGLMDGNVHLVLNSSIEFMARYEGRYEELIEEAAQVTLKNGVTTVFDTWGPLQPLLNVRERIKRGETIGSRLFVAGNIVGFSSPLGRDFNYRAEDMATKALVKRVSSIWEENVGPDLQYMTPEQVRAEIRKYISRGIDFLKYASDGHRDEFQRFLMFSGEVQRAIVEESHSAGLLVQAHTSSNEGLRVALQAGIDSVTHVGTTGPVEMADSTISTLVKDQIPSGILPRTKKRYEIEMKRAGDDEFRRRWLELKTLNQDRLIKEGVPVILTTDAGLMDPDRFAELKPEEREDGLSALGEGHFLWCEAVSERGLSPMKIILAATRNVAAAYNKLDQLGTLEEGKIADLLILNEDPLADISNLRNIFLVMKDGETIDRRALPTRKILTIEDAEIPGK